MFYDNIVEATVKNKSYRKVVYTDSNERGIQLVYMSLKPKEEIGLEIHPSTTQFFRIESGFGIAKVGERTLVLKDDISFIVPAGIEHNVKNISSTKPLKLYTIYSPPQHPAGTEERFKK
jgi:mannose-6-phosphate isomerase-like protein (cupin superfamily)